MIGDPALLRAGGLGVILREGCGDEGGDDTVSALAGVGEDVANEVYAAALPGGVQHLGDGGLDAFVGVGDHQLDAAQAAAGELTQERSSERLGLGGADIKPENLAPSVAVDADRNVSRRLRLYGRLAHFDVGGVDPQIQPVALDRPTKEGLHLVIDLLAQPADPALGDAAHSHRLDQIVDRAGRDPVDIGLLDPPR